MEISSNIFRLIWLDIKLNFNFRKRRKVDRENIDEMKTLNWVEVTKKRFKETE